jgi:hypothetical protein
MCLGVVTTRSLWVTVWVVPPACFKLYGPFQAVITESFLTPPAIAP